MFRRIPFAALLLVAVAATAWYGFFFFGDNFVAYFPMKLLTSQSWRHGEVPYWNFFLSAGQPLAGNPNALAFYPLDVLYLLLPAHVAFNLHFLIHAIGGAFAMRALCLARGTSRESATFAAIVYALSGVVISSFAFYNLVVAVAMIPLALLAVERRSVPLLGVAFGLLILAAEPVTLLGALIPVAISSWRRFPIRSLAMSVAISAIVAAPQLIAFFEISGDVNRTAGIDPANVLGTALSLKRIAEIFVWPLSGSLMDPQGGAHRVRLFSTIFIGVIALPALWITLRKRSRFVFAALVLLFLAASNPIVTAAVIRFEWLRLGRYPEKFVLPMTVVIVMLIGEYFDRARFRKAWIAITLLPLAWAAYRAMPIDWFSLYHYPQVTPRRAFIRPDPKTGIVSAREEARQRTRDLEPLWAMPIGINYLMMPAGDGIQSRLTYIAVSRFHNGPVKTPYLQIAGADVPGALPEAMIVPRTVIANSVHEAVRVIESPAFDPHRVAVAPFAFASAPARITKYQREGQTITIDVDARGPALLFVNQTYFKSWVAMIDGEELPIVSLDLDRLGVLVPQSGRVVLRFGRYRVAVAIATALSFLTVAAIFLRELIEKRNRGAGEVERSGDDDVSLGRV